MLQENPINLLFIFVSSERLVHISGPRGFEMKNGLLYYKWDPLQLNTRYLQKILQNITKHFNTHIMQIYHNLSNIRFAGKQYEIKHQRLL